MAGTRRLHYPPPFPNVNNQCQTGCYSSPNTAQCVYLPIVTRSVSSCQRHFNSTHLVNKKKNRRKPTEQRRDNKGTRRMTGTRALARPYYQTRQFCMTDVGQTCYLSISGRPAICQPGWRGAKHQEVWTRGGRPPVKDAPN